MTQTVPATCVLGPGKTGLTIGLRVLNLDGTTYAAFATTNVAETSIAGTYRKAGGVVVPAAGGYIVWGTALVDYAEATVESTAVNVTHSAGIATGGRLAEVTDLPAAAPSAATVADAVWDEALSGHAAAGSTGARLDTTALEATAQAVLLDTGTTLPALIGGLSGGTVTVVSSVDGGTVTVYAADTWRFTVLSDQLALADYETLGLIVKRSARQADTQALLYLRTDTGLVRMDGAAPVSAGNGVLTKTATSFTAVVHVAETQGLAPGGYRWWLKGLDTTPAPDEAVTLATGEFVVLAAGMQAVV